VNALIPLLKLDEVVECRIVERTSRFTLTVEVGDKRETAYTNNTGRLRNYIVPGRTGYCLESKRGKLKLRIVGVEDGEYAALIDTRLQEESLLAAWRYGLVYWLTNCTLYKRNYRLDNVVVDFAFKCNNGDLRLVEVKSAVMKISESVAGYPDAPTARGRRQLIKLAEYAASGGSAYVVFIAGIPLARKFKLYCGEDKEIKRCVEVAASSGVVFKAINLFLDSHSRTVVLGGVDIPVDLSCESES
jgi:sugar fermentation stimulation protein A